MFTANQRMPDVCPPARPLVLLVDGSADVRGTIREMLADVSCNIAEARDSREGLRVIADREQTPGGGFELLWGSSWAAWIVCSARSRQPSMTRSPSSRF
jgi:hypothetical protein